MQTVKRIHSKLRKRPTKKAIQEVFGKTAVIHTRKGKIRVMIPKGPNKSLCSRYKLHMEFNNFNEFFEYLKNTENA